MKLNRIAAALLLTLPVIASADQSVPVTPDTPQAWLDRMTDMTKNGTAFRDPKTFTAWFNAVTEPSFYVTMGNNMLEPGNWVKMGAAATEPGVIGNFVQFSDPAVAAKWMGAAMDPNFYTAIMTTGMDIGKWTRWFNASLDLNSYAPAIKTLDPNLYLKWMTASMNMNTYQPFMKMMDPAYYTKVATVAADPKTYGVWGSFADPATYGNVASAFDFSKTFNFAPVAAPAPAAK
jgi:hypothetical protein